MDNNVDPPTMRLQGRRSFSRFLIFLFFSTQFRHTLLRAPFFFESNADNSSFFQQCIQAGRSSDDASFARCSRNCFGIFSIFLKHFRHILLRVLFVFESNADNSSLFLQVEHFCNDMNRLSFLVFQLFQKKCDCDRETSKKTRISNRSPFVFNFTDTHTHTHTQPRKASQYSHSIRPIRV